MLVSSSQVRHCDTRASGGSARIWVLSHTINNKSLFFLSTLALEDLVSMQEIVWDLLDIVQTTTFIPTSNSQTPRLPDSALSLSTGRSTFYAVGVTPGNCVGSLRHSSNHNLHSNLQLPDSQTPRLSSLTLHWKIYFLCSGCDTRKLCGIS